MAKGKKTGGRVKGTPNNTTLWVKTAIETAYREIGGDNAFAEWAKLNKTEFYKMTCKLLPRDIHVNANVRLEDIVAGSEDPEGE